MQIGNRHFPYPVLNHNRAYSDYCDRSDFYLDFTRDDSNAIIIEDGELILKDLHFCLSDPALEELYEDGYLGCYLIVECSASVFREKYDISNEPSDLHIPATNFNDRVEFSSYLYATKDINDYQSDSFDPFYKDYGFNIEKYDIVAIDDGFKMRININPSQDDKVSSIFTIVKTQTDQLVMKASYSENGITIALPKDAYTSYETIKTKKEFNNIAFSMIAIPALSDCLRTIQNTEYTSVEEIVDDLRWFRAVCKSFYAKTKKELDFDTFENMEMLELSQMVLNDATCNGIIDFGNMLISPEEDDDE